MAAAVIAVPTSPEGVDRAVLAASLCDALPDEASRDSGRDVFKACVAAVSCVGVGAASAREQALDTLCRALSSSATERRDGENDDSSGDVSVGTGSVDWLAANQDDTDAVIAVACAARVAEGDVPNPHSLVQLCAAAAAALPPAHLIPAVAAAITSASSAHSAERSAVVWVARCLSWRLPPPSREVSASAAVAEVAAEAIESLQRAVEAAAAVRIEGDGCAEATATDAAAARVSKAIDAAMPVAAAIAVWAASEEHPSSKLARGVCRGSGAAALISLCARCGAPRDDGAAVTANDTSGLLANASDARQAATAALSAVVTASAGRMAGAASRDSGKDARATVSSTIAAVLPDVLRRVCPAHAPSRAGCGDAVLWAVTHVRYPDLEGAPLAAAVSACLRLVERHEPVHRVPGLAALAHVLNTALPTELRITGTADVVMGAVAPLVYDREPSAVAALRPALVAALTVAEPRPSVKGSKLHDKVFAKLLHDMEFETDFGRRRELNRTASEVAPLLGVGVVRHLAVVLRVALSYLAEDTDRPSQVAAARLLSVTVQHGWPRVRCRAGALADTVRELFPPQSETSASSGAQKGSVVAELRIEVEACLSMLDALHAQQQELMRA